jgi:hypothetical protein
MATNPRVRVGGSGFTVFQWQDSGNTHLIGYAQNVTVNPVQPVAQPVSIQPLNAQRPLEIITPGAHTNGTITLTLTELYNRAIWQRMASLAGCQDIVDIMRTLAAMDNGPVITKTIRPGYLPDGSGDYAETFYGIAVASVEDSGGESISYDTMQLDKTMTLWYTHSKKIDYSGIGDYKWPRDVRAGAT